MNKRGQIFTIIAIALIVLMFVTFEVFSIIHERQAVKTRVSTMDSFLYSIEKNLERQMYISGFRIIFLAENEITSKGSYISDIDDFFEEAFFNATVNGVANNAILSGATYDDIINSLNIKAAKISVDIIMTGSNISVNQEDPWHVKFTLVSNFVMQDKHNLARWEKQQSISALIPVQGFEDPFYTIGGGGGFSRKINQTLYEGNYTSWPDVNNLRNHVAEGYYAANSDAPSFLKRLEGNFSSDANGIESFVRSSDVNSLEDKTLIDYLYFDPSDSTAGSIVSGMQAWFKIDEGHKAKYGVV